VKALYWLNGYERMNIKSRPSLTRFSILWPLVYSAFSRSQHTLFTLRHCDQTVIIAQSHSSILPTCFT